MSDRSTEIAIVLSGQARRRRYDWTIVQPDDPDELYALIHQLFKAQPRKDHYPGRTQSCTDLMRYHAVLVPPPHPGMAKRFKRYLTRFNPWRSPRYTHRELDKILEQKEQIREKKEKERREAELKAEELKAELDAKLIAVIREMAEAGMNTNYERIGGGNRKERIENLLKPGNLAGRIMFDEEDDDDPGYNKFLLMIRILELEDDIQLLKDENENRATLREDLEHGIKELEKSKRVFELRRNKEYEEISKTKEQVRLEREHVRQVTLALSEALDKKTAEDQTKEITELRGQVTSLQADLRRRTTRWNTMSQTMKETIEKLRSEKQSLLEAVGKKADTMATSSPKSKKPSTS